MFYGGENNVPGAPGNVGAYSNSISGTWAQRDFPQGQQLRQTLPQAMGASGMIPMGNAGFFMGPQAGQDLPPGYTNKTIS
jgi:hypothetical protein